MTRMTTSTQRAVMRAGRGAWGPPFTDRLDAFAVEGVHIFASRTRSPAADAAEVRLEGGAGRAVAGISRFPGGVAVRLQTVNQILNLNPTPRKPDLATTVIPPGPPPAPPLYTRCPANVPRRRA